MPSIISHARRLYREVPDRNHSDSVYPGGINGKVSRSSRGRREERLAELGQQPSEQPGSGRVTPGIQPTYFISSAERGIVQRRAPCGLFQRLVADGMVQCCVLAGLSHCLLIDGIVQNTSSAARPLPSAG